ncbi:MAG: Yip1 family protein [Gammaproteobacteria bacterium]|nr:Yip1 family protein [Gammaproteobacteria bacterium]
MHARLLVLTPWHFVRLMIRPSDAGACLASAAPETSAVLLRLVIPLSLVPPLLAYIGGAVFGWHLGGGTPLYISPAGLTLISLGYFVALITGFLSTAAVASWMADTYGAKREYGTHLAFVVLVGMPVILASVGHLAPHAFVNMIVLIPALIWSLYLLYRCLPAALGTSPERGMLMASSLVAYLLVAGVSLLGITVVLWTGGIGPTLGV